VKHTSLRSQSAAPLQVRKVHSSWTQRNAPPGLVETHALPGVLLSHGCAQPWSPAVQVSGLVGTQKPAGGTMHAVQSLEQTSPAPHPVGNALKSHASSGSMTPLPHGGGGGSQKKQSMQE
jgi:hypothetical protein